jgi:hypothetical protein
VAGRREVVFAARRAPVNVLPNVCVTDSHVVQASYRERFKHEATYIPYGSELERRAPGETLARLGLTPGRYVLFVGVSSLKTASTTY